MTKNPKIRVVWIDDIRNPGSQLSIWVNTQWKRYVPEEFLNAYHDADYKAEVVWLKSYDEWLKWVVETWHQEDDDEYINCFCLDHDLGSYDKDGNEKTGVDVAKDIIDELIISGRKMPYYECHSSNPAGKDNILSVFESFKKHFCQ